jgi:hypothetical protein
MHFFYLKNGHVVMPFKGRAVIAISIDVWA